MEQRSAVIPMDSLEVHRDLSGGVRIKLGRGQFVLSPDDAIAFASAILKAAGCNVAIEGRGPQILRPV